MLTVENVSKKFGSLEVLKDVSFKVKSGEIVALLGKNGAGKSTLLKIISGYIDSDFGKICLDNCNIQNERIKFLENLAYVPENSSLYSDMSVYEFLEFTANIRCKVENQMVRKIREICAAIGLNDVLFQKCETLSKGYKKRVAIAAALLDNSTLVLLDEPTEGLDPSQKIELHKSLKKMAKNHHIIISTHLMEDVEAVADRIVLIDKGKVLCNLSLNEFKKFSKNSLMDAFNVATKG